MSLSELSKDTGIAWSLLKGRLAAAHVSPAFPFDRMRGVIYRRLDVAGVADLGPGRGRPR